MAIINIGGSFADTVYKSLFVALKFICGEEVDAKTGKIMPIKSNIFVFLNDLSVIFKNDAKLATNYILSAYNDLQAKMNSDADYKKKVEDTKPASRMACFTKLARFRLPTGANQDFAYVIPYNDTLKVDLSYQGIVALAMRSVPIKHVDAQIIFTGDKIINPHTDSNGYWTFDGITTNNPFQSIKVDIKKVKKEYYDKKSGQQKSYDKEIAEVDFYNIEGVIVYIYMNDGTIIKERRTKQFLMEAYSRSQAKESTTSPWGNGFVQSMLVKTAIRSVILQKYFTGLDNEDRAAIKQDEASTMDYRSASTAITSSSRTVDEDFLNQITKESSDEPERRTVDSSGGEGQTEAERQPDSNQNDTQKGFDGGEDSRQMDGDEAKPRGLY